jgi:hypothetical protein
LYHCGDIIKSCELGWSGSIGKRQLLWSVRQFYREMGSCRLQPGAVGGYAVEFDITEGNVKFSLSVPRIHTRRVNVQLQSLLTCAPDAGEWSALRPGRFNPGGRSRRYPLNRGWVGPRADLDVLENT